MKSILVLVLALGISITSADYKDQWQKYEDLLHQYQTNPTLRRQWMNHTRQWFKASKADIIAGRPSDDKFPCAPESSASPPSSVHRLLPGDIKVIGALGDSVTAGNGILAINVPDILFQDRGHSFSIGGYKSYEEGVITVANMLKLYNNKLYGYSTGGGDVDSEYAKFNLAVPGSTCPNMPGDAVKLVERMQKDSTVNYALDWKMVTLFVGGNDLCWACNDEDKLNPVAFLTNIKKTLDILSVRMPRTLVNVVPIMDVTPLALISDGLVCDSVQAVICPCGTDHNLAEKIKRYQREYSQKTAELISSGIYDREDFTVVFQPFLRDTKPPTKSDGKADVSYFAPDCFHFSEKGHKALARNLFISMFQPVGEKSTSITFKEDIVCPPKGTFIQTNLNKKVSTTPVITNAPTTVSTKPTNAPTIVSTKSTTVSTNAPTTVSIKSTTVEMKNYKAQWEKYEDLLHQYQTNPTLRRQWMNHTRQWFKASKADILAGRTSDDKFPCAPDSSASPPSSVHMLLPGDIKVIGALGDSVTSGNGILAVNIPDILFQDRGHSFSIGGYQSYEEGVITVANMLKLSNNKLYGYSTGGGDVDSEYAKFNLAVPANTIPDIPGDAMKLVERMQKDSTVNYDLDWKMVTLFIGGNDLCWACNDEDQLNPVAFLTNMKETLDILSVRMPRTLVNVVPIMDITPLALISDGLVCDTVQSLICPCGTDPNLAEKIKRYQKEYSQKTAELISSGLYDREDFTVVFQPFLRDTKPPTKSDGKPDVSYFAPDCFHFSEKGHKALARNLFTSMFQPVGEKSTSITFKEDIVCPPKGTFIQTNLNKKVSTTAVITNPPTTMSTKSTTVPTKPPTTVSTKSTTVPNKPPTTVPTKPTTGPTKPPTTVPTKPTTVSTKPPTTVSTKSTNVPTNAPTTVPTKPTTVPTKPPTTVPTGPTTTEDISRLVIEPFRIAPGREPTVNAGARAVLLTVGGLVGGICVVLALVGASILINMARKRTRAHALVI